MRLSPGPQNKVKGVLDLRSGSLFVPNNLHETTAVRRTALLSVDCHVSAVGCGVFHRSASDQSQPCNRPAFYMRPDCPLPLLALGQDGAGSSPRAFVQRLCAYPKVGEDAVPYLCCGHHWLTTREKPSRWLGVLVCSLPLLLSLCLREIRSCDRLLFSSGLLTAQLFRRLRSNFLACSH